MGWGSATGIFDKAIESFIEYVPKKKRAKAVMPFFKELVDGDWDTISESNYFYDDFMLKVLRSVDFFDGDWYPESQWKEGHKEYGNQAKRFKKPR